MNKILIFFCSLLLSIMPSFSLDYDYTSTRRIPIRLQVCEEINTQNPPSEGTILNFKVIGNVISKGQWLAKSGDIVQGKVETIITSGMNGFPYEIILSDFQIPNIRQSQLIGTYIKTGQNRCYWVYPLKWALTPLPPTGSLTNLIKGGHASIKPKDIITIYYYPDWK